jgi:restriction system protein
MPRKSKGPHMKEASKTGRSAVSLPAVQPLLLPVLKMTAEGKSVAEIRERLKKTFHINPSDAQRKHRNGMNIYVNRVAWALSHLVTGKAITLKGRGWYQVTDRGMEILKSGPSELTIQDLH